jgi:hypothetical protein
MAGQGEDEDDDPEVSHEALVQDAESMLREIDEEAEQEHKGVFQLT